MAIKLTESRLRKIIREVLEEVMDADPANMPREVYSQIEQAITDACENGQEVDLYTMGLSQDIPTSFIQHVFETMSGDAAYTCSLEVFGMQEDGSQRAWLTPG
jgi:hypothetical protein